MNIEIHLRIKAKTAKSIIQFDNQHGFRI